MRIIVGVAYACPRADDFPYYAITRLNLHILAQSSLLTLHGERSCMIRPTLSIHRSILP